MNIENIARKTRGMPVRLSASVCFSIGGLLIKIIPWNPFAINGSRNLIAACVIGLYIYFTGHRMKFNFTVLAGAVCMAGVTTLFTVANKLTTAGNAIVLQYTEPVWVILLMFVFFRKKPSGLEIITIISVLIGILCFFFDSLSTGKVMGDFIAVLSGLFYAGMFMLNQFKEGDALSSMVIGQLLCGVFLTPMVLRETVFSPSVLAAVFVLGTVQVGLAYILFSIGTKLTDPVTASIINAAEPILNPILVAVFYGEVLGRLSLAGAAIVIGSILFYNIRQSGLWKSQTGFQKFSREERIAFYEQIFDQLSAADPETDLSDEMKRQYRLLEEYYTSGEWRGDYEADEAGLLPPDLKRGVLSQDGVYNLLEHFKEGR